MRPIGLAGSCRSALAVFSVAVLSVPVALVVALVVALTAEVAAAQGAAPRRRIEGAVNRSLGGGRSAPVAGAWVILHRVGADDAGPLDSMRTRSNGSYAFRYRATGDTTAIYFVSTLRGGVAYFTPPSREPLVGGGAADLTVFDTTSVPFPITIRGRHLIVTAPDSGAPRLRTVIEVYELSNDSARTRVPGEEQRFTFEAPVPSGVDSVTGGQGDVSPDAMRVEAGRLRIYAPIAPGLKQFSFQYEVDVAAPLAYPIDEAVPVLEVLVEDARGTASGAELLEVSPVSVEGRPFKRFLAQEVTAPAVVYISAPGSLGDARKLRVLMIVTAIGATMLFALGAIFLRRGPGALAGRRARDKDPETLAREIAALDTRFASIASPSEELRNANFVERARLKGQLNASLARRDELT